MARKMVRVRVKMKFEQVAQVPTMREWLEHTQQAKPVPTKRSAAEIIRELRNER
jgi:hypothetical protein